MANPSQAARALLFQQQCRQKATRPPRYHRAIFPTVRTISDTSSLDPSNFGKKLRLDPNSPEPLPEWRRPKPDPQETDDPDSQSPSSSITPRNNPYDFPRARDAPIPRHRNNPAVKAGFWSYVKYNVLRMKEPPNPNLTRLPSFNVLTNPYRARKDWPPILKDMSELQQFHYEKKFRRRLLKKTLNMRRTWDNSALFLRRFSITFVVLWFCFMYMPEEPEKRLPTDGLRYWVFGQLKKGNGEVEERVGKDGEIFMVREGGVWSRKMQNWIERRYNFYRLKHKRQWDPYNHEGWDESRPRNSLPGGALGTPNQLRSLEEQERDRGIV